MSSSNFYVDNLAKTCNSENELTDLYYQAGSRLQIRGFHLQPCNSNCLKLRKIMKQDLPMGKSPGLQVQSWVRFYKSRSMDLWPWIEYKTCYSFCRFWYFQPFIIVSLNFHSKSDTDWGIVETQAGLGCTQGTAAALEHASRRTVEVSLFYIWQESLRWGQ